ncbi:peptide chain release factor N(5)-glutamine methyltransferase [candidate division KSB1 bacterium]
MNLLELLKVSIEHLKSQGLDNPKTSCEILLAHTLNMKRLDLYLNYDLQLKESEISEFRKLYKRRLNREPLQYILGETEFMSLPFKINTDVLIPRPETELLVEKIIDFCKSKWTDKPLKILDIGSGSGNISVSLAHYLSESEVIGIDVSPESIKVAEANGKLNNVQDRVRFIVEDILSVDEDHPDFKDLNVIVSNPPYVTTDSMDILQKEVIDHEPHAALFAGKDGMIFFRKIASIAKNRLNEGGLLVFETGYDIGEKVKSLVMENGFRDVNLIKDYAGINRIVMGIK